MPDTADTLAEIAPDTRTMRLRREEVYARAKQLGAETDAQRMELLGMRRPTYYRALRGCNLSLAIADQAARALGWTVDQTFERAA